MLRVTVPERTLYDEKTGLYEKEDACVIEIEHSLFSISKWEAKYQKPFLSSEKTEAEVYYYIKCMTLNDVPNSVYARITRENYERIKQYIDSKHTATTIKPLEGKGAKRSQHVTSELVYYWMSKFQIPYECDKWNFGRLMTLIDVCNHEEAPKKKMSGREVASRYKAANAARRKAHGSRG